jgi:glycosyltransferase involved in cell wall biosynthesis
MPRFSVILPAYNVSAHLGACLDGLSRMQVEPGAVEILVVDNNSTDDSVAIASGFPGVRVLHEPVQSSYAARNLGVRESTGEYLAFLDPDCRPEPQWLDALYAGLQHEGTHVVLGRRSYGDSWPLSLACAYEAEKIAWIVERRIPELYYGYTNNMGMRRSTFEQLGPFQIRARGADTMLVRRIVDALGCDAVRYEPEMLVRHLEMRTIADYLQKRAVYGGSNERVAREIAFRPLRSAERWAIYRRTLGSGTSLVGAAALLALLVAGAFIYEWARRRVA